MKILVTGGSGFIGKNYILKRLDEYPDDVVLNIDKLTYASNEEDIVNERYKHLQVDICSEVISDIVNDFNPDIVVHFAAESHVDNSIENPDSFINSNILGTFNLLKSCRTLAMKKTDFRFLHVSTDEVYGSLGDDGEFTEETAYDPRSPYSASKSASDHLVKSYFHTYGFPALVTNCSNNYGPHQHLEKLIPKIITNYLNKDKIPVYGEGLNVRDWLYVTDHCDAINVVLEKGRLGETYNIGGDCEMKNIEIVEHIIDELGGNRWDLIEHVKDRLGHDWRYAINHSKITDELGWTPKVSFREGIKKTIKFYKEKFRGSN